MGKSFLVSGMNQLTNRKLSMYQYLFIINEGDIILRTNEGDYPINSGGGNINLNNYYTSTEIDTLFNGVYTNYYTRTNIDQRFDNYYTKLETNANITDYVENELEQYYDKTETDNIISNQLSNYHTVTQTDSILSNYYTSAQSDTNLDNAISELFDGTTEGFDSISDITNWIENTGMTNDLSNLSSDLTEEQKADIRAKLGITGTGFEDADEYNLKLID